MSQRPVQPTTIYGVFEVPTYIVESRRVDSTWDNEQRALDRARQRSIQVHGRVFVLSWTVNTPGSHTITAFVDGEPARTGPPT